MHDNDTDVCLPGRWLEIAESCSVHLEAISDQLDSGSKVEIETNSASTGAQNATTPLAMPGVCQRQA